MAKLNKKGNKTGQHLLKNPKYASFFPKIKIISRQTITFAEQRAPTAPVNKLRHQKTSQTTSTTQHPHHNETPTPHPPIL
jgi:hypothetical protein